MSLVDKIKAQDHTIKIGKALMYPEKYLESPLVIASYQGYVEIKKELDKLHREKETLLKALNFYADKTNYQGSPSLIDMQDNGDKAREVIKMLGYDEEKGMLKPKFIYGKAIEKELKIFDEKLGV